MDERYRIQYLPLGMYHTCLTLSRSEHPEMRQCAAIEPAPPHTVTLLSSDLKHALEVAPIAAGLIQLFDLDIIPGRQAQALGLVGA